MWYINWQDFTQSQKKSCSSNQAYFELSKELSGQRHVYEPRWVFKSSCYVDSDFGGLFGSEDPINPVSVKSRIGYIIKVGNFPILWVSKLQTQIALSTMETE